MITRNILICGILIVGISAYLLFYPNPSIRIGPHRLTYELADTPQKRETGLMFRDTLARDHGMLFVFPDTQEPCCFWMKNTYIPLDIAFIDNEFRVTDIISRQPRSEQSSCVPAARYVLETNQGWFQRNAVKKGSRIAIFKTILLEKKDNLWY